MSPTAKRRLLERLLEAHERSQSHGKPAPWPRDVILAFDAREFPEAFGTEGREELAALKLAAGELERAGAVRLVRHGGFAQGELREVRLGPAEVEAAYRLAETEGFEPLRRALDAVGEHARALSTGPAETALPGWMACFLEQLAAALPGADTSPLGMQRPRFKREWRDVVDALTAVVALSRGVSGWERLVREQVLGHSKRLAAVRPLVAQLLVRADPQWEGIELEEGLDVLEAYGVRRKPGLLRCAGCAELRIGERAYRLEDFVPVAHLPEGWSDAWVEGLDRAGVRQVTTIENEFPFLSYVEEAGGPAGLGRRGEVAVYTAGFPAPSLVATLRRLAERRAALGFRHWGDADVGGLSIWWLLRGKLGRPVELFRTTAEWLRGEVARGGSRLSAAEQKALRRMREQLAGSPVGGESDVGTALRLIEALESTGVKVEQERYGR